MKQEPNSRDLGISRLQAGEQVKATLFASTATNHLHLSLSFPAWKQEGYRRLRRSLLPC